MSYGLESKVISNGIQHYSSIRYVFTKNTALVYLVTTECPFRLAEEAGLFDENFKEPLMEDWELGIRLHQRSYIL